MSNELSGILVLFLNTVVLEGELLNSIIKDEFNLKERHIRFIKNFAVIF